MKTEKANSINALWLFSSQKKRDKKTVHISNWYKHKCCHSLYLLNELRVRFCFCRFWFWFVFLFVCFSASLFSNKNGSPLYNNHGVLFLSFFWFCFYIILFRSICLWFLLCARSTASLNWIIHFINGPFSYWTLTYNMILIWWATLRHLTCSIHGRMAKWWDNTEERINEIKWNQLTLISYGF